jgi:hypothetical protein
MQMSKHSNRLMVLVAAALSLAATTARAQFQLSGDFMTRNYWESFSGDRDNRENLEYMRFMGQLSALAPLGTNGRFRTDLVTISDNPVYPSRSLAGLGGIRFGLSQIYGEFTQPDILGFDMARVRFGRQHYELGSGLTLGESYYQIDDYDGIRVDFARDAWTLGVFGAVTEQALTPDGFYPEPQSDQLYVAQAQYALKEHTLLAYTVYEKKRGDFNDNIIVGGGASGNIVLPKLLYFAEIAQQTWNTPAGLPDKGGIGYMAGVSYGWSMPHVRSAKAEIRTAAYQGDDAATADEEMFSPYYPSWWWGDRTGYANGNIGGDYPNHDKQVEGSRVWYGRVYVSPTFLPKSRIQLQYVTVADYVNNDNYTEPDDEFGVKLYYDINDNVSVQGRYFRRIPNGGDFDQNGDGNISQIEDKVTANRLMFEFRVQF